MNTDPSSRRAIVDVPLPGHYDLITAQINVTTYVKTGVVKWVATLRDPSPDRQIELWRKAGMTPWTDIRGMLSTNISDLLDSMLYLGQLP